MYQDQDWHVGRHCRLLRSATVWWSAFRILFSRLGTMCAGWCDLERFRYSLLQTVVLPFLHILPALALALLVGVSVGPGLQVLGRVLGDVQWAPVAPTDVAAQLPPPEEARRRWTPQSAIVVFHPVLRWDPRLRQSLVCPCPVPVLCVQCLGLSLGVLSLGVLFLDVPVPGCPRVPAPDGGRSDCETGALHATQRGV